MSEEEIKELKSKIDDGMSLEYLKSIKKDGKDIYDLIREILENNTLSGEDKAYLLLQTDDFEFCKSILCTGGAKEYKIDLNSFFGGANEYFENQDNSSFAKEVLEKNDVGDTKIGKILDVIEDKEYLEKIIMEGKYEFESQSLRQSIKKIGNPQFAEYVLKNNEKYGLRESDIIMLLRGLKLVELSKEIVLNADIYGLTSKGIEKLVDELGLEDISGKIALSADKLGIDSQTIVKFAKMSNDKDVIEEVLGRYSSSLNRNETLDLLKMINPDAYERNEMVFKNDATQNKLIKEIDYLDVDDQKNILMLFNRKTLQEYRADVLSTDNIEKNLNFFIEREGLNDEQIKNLYKFLETNENVLKCDFKVLDKKYVLLFGEEKINLISSFPEMVEKLLNFNDETLNLASNLINEYIKESEGEEWTKYAEVLFNNLGQYESFIEDMSKSGENISLDKLSIILSRPNILEIDSMSDFKNYQEIMNTKTDALIKSDDLDEKKYGVLLKTFGITIEEASKIVEIYGDDIETIKDENVKAYVNSISEIMHLNDIETLETIYNLKSIDIKEKNPILMESRIKRAFGELYNEKLLDVKKLERVDGYDEMYNAGTDFNMVITMVGAYDKCNNGKKYSANLKEDWNRPSLGVQHFCASYIRNDMIGTVNSNEAVCYGFTEMGLDSLVMAAPYDLHTNMEKKFNSNSEKQCKWYSPDNQINNTDEEYCYNELDYRRIQGNKRKQPSYLVAFKKGSEILNLEKVLKAQSEWSTSDKKFPIVLVDIDECLAAEKSKLDIMLKEAILNKDPKLAEQVLQKIKNNKKTCYRFNVSSNNYFQNINLGEVEAMLKSNNVKFENESVKETERVTTNSINQNKDGTIPLEEQDITREDLEEIDAEVKPNEREACSCVILLDEIKKIKKRQGEKVYGR